MEPAEAETSKWEIEISAPANFVYSYLVTGDKIAPWILDDKLIVTFPNGSTVKEGMLIKFGIRVPTNPSWTVEIKKLVPERVMETDVIDGIFRGSLSFYLDPVGSQKTLFRHEAVIIPHGRFIRFAWDVAGRKIHKDKMDELLKKMKEKVEQDWSANHQTAQLQKEVTK